VASESCNCSVVRGYTTDWWKHKHSKTVISFTLCFSVFVHLPQFRHMQINENGL